MDIWNAMYGVSDTPGKEFGPGGDGKPLIAGFVAFILPITKFIE
jgi:hypothetical protein